MYVLRIYIILDKYNRYLGGEYIRKTAKKPFFLHHCVVAWKALEYTNRLFVFSIALISVSSFHIITLGIFKIIFWIVLWRITHTWISIFGH